MSHREQQNKARNPSTQSRRPQETREDKWICLPVCVVGGHGERGENDSSFGRGRDGLGRNGRRHRYEFAQPEPSYEAVSFSREVILSISEVVDILRELGDFVLILKRNKEKIKHL